MTSRRLPAAVLAVVMLLPVGLAACTASDPGSTPPSPTEPASATTPPPEVPGDEWDRADVDPAAFATLDSTAQLAGSTCVAVVKDGELLHDAYWAGGAADTPRAAYSITKSMASLLVGMAEDDVKLTLDDRASDYIPSWRGSDADGVTVRDLLANTSGRHWDYATDYTGMVRNAKDKTAFAIQLEQDARPGTEWAYNNSAVQTLEEVLAKTIGDDVTAFGRERLLEPLGMDDTTWEADSAGNAKLFSGVSSTCLDLARVGLLMLRDGAWGDEQIVSRDFVREATGRSSSTLNAAYGLLWWVNREGRVVEARRAAGYPADKAPYDGRLAPDVPEDAFWAFGYGNEYVAVVPSEGVVAVRMGTLPPSPDQLTFNSFTAAVLDAVEAS